MSIFELLDIDKKNKDSEKSNLKEPIEKIEKKVQHKENSQLKEKENDLKDSKKEIDIKDEKNMKQQKIMSDKERDYWLKYLEEINLNDNQDNDILEQQKPINLEKTKGIENGNNNVESSDNNEIVNKKERINDDSNLEGIPDKDYFQNLITNNQGSHVFLKEWFKFNNVEETEIVDIEQLQTNSLEMKNIII